MQLNGLQSQHKYDGVRDMLSQVYRRNGLAGFYKGFLATCLKIVPTTAILFVCNDKIKKLIMSEEELTYKREASTHGAIYFDEMQEKGDV